MWREINQYGIIRNGIIRQCRKYFIRKADLAKILTRNRICRISRWILVYIIYRSFWRRNTTSKPSYILLETCISNLNAVSARSSVSVEILRHAPSSVLLEKPDACRFIADIYLLKQRRLGKHSRFVAHKTSDAHTIQCVQQGINARSTGDAYVHWLRVCRIIRNIIQDIRTNSWMILENYITVYIILYHYARRREKKRINKFFF